MLHIDPNTRITQVNNVLRLSINRPSGALFRYGLQVNSHELIFKCSGEAVNTIDGRDYHLTPGSVFYLPSGTLSSYVSRTIAQGEAIDIHFDGTPLSCAPLILPPPHRGRIGQLFANCSETWREGSEIRQIACLGLLYTLLAELRMEQDSPQIGESAAALLATAVSWLDAHCFDAKFSIALLPVVTGISQSYLNRLFQKQYGMPPSRYVTQKRIERAKELLVFPENSVTHISQLTGYGSVYYFSRVFHQETGLSPQEYRKLL